MYLKTIIQACVGAAAIIHTDLNDCGVDRTLTRYERIIKLIA